MPGIPTNVQATGSTGSATLSWTAPPQGAGPIDRYLITSYPPCPSCHGLGVSGSPAPTSATVSGLPSPGEYTFAVTAENIDGPGPISEPSSIAVVSSSLGAPSAPRDVVASARDGSILVGFEPPANDGGSPITGYKIDATPLLASVPSTSINASPECIISFEGHCLLYLPARSSQSVQDGAWSLQYEGAPYSFLLHMTCPSVQECIGVGATMSASSSSGISYAPYAIATYDAGLHWQQLALGATSNTLLTSVSCTSTSSCVAGAVPAALSLSATPQLYYTSDAGATWAHASVPQGFETLQGISCVAGTATCFSAGIHGLGSSAVIESSDSGASWQGTSTSPPFGFTSAFVPQITGNAISCASTTSCAITGVKVSVSFSAIRFAPAIAATHDAGATWSASSLGPATSPGSLEVPTAVSCASASTCTAVGYDYFGSSGSVAWSTTDAASTWDELNPASGLGNHAKAFLYSVSCPSTIACYTTGFSTSGASLFSPVIEGSTDSGAIWTAESVPSEAYSALMLASVSCASANNCEAGGVMGSPSGIRAAAIGADRCGVIGTVCNTAPQPTPGAQNPVAGAANGTTYQVSVTATNSYGASVPGPAVYAATPIAVPRASYASTGPPPVVATLIGHTNANYLNNTGSPKLTLSYNSQSLLTPATSPSPGYHSRHVDRDCGESSPVKVGSATADLWVFCDTATTDFHPGAGSNLPAPNNHFTPSGTAAVQRPLPSPTASPQPPNLTEDVSGVSNPTFPCSSSGWPLSSQSSQQPTVNGQPIAEGQPCPFLPSEGPGGTSTAPYSAGANTTITTAELYALGATATGGAPPGDPDSDNDDDTNPVLDPGGDGSTSSGFCIVSHNELDSYTAKYPASGVTCQALQSAGLATVHSVTTNQYKCSRWTAGLATQPVNSFTTLPLGGLSNQVLAYYQHWCFPIINSPNNVCVSGGICQIDTTTSGCATSASCARIVFVSNNYPGWSLAIGKVPTYSPSVGVAQVDVAGASTNQPSSSYDNLFPFSTPQELPCSSQNSPVCDYSTPPTPQDGFASGAVLGPNGKHLYVYTPVGNWSHFVYVARINLETASACTVNSPDRPAWACDANYKYYHGGNTWSSTTPSMGTPPYPVYTVPHTSRHSTWTAQDALIAGGAGTFSVSKVGEGYVMVFQPEHGPYSGEMQIAYAAKPWGPFTPTSGVVIPGCNTSGVSAANGCYDYLLHPELDPAGGSSLVFSYFQEGIYSNPPIPAGCGTLTSGCATGHVRFASVPMACVIATCSTAGGGYWEAGSDGGVFAFGAPFDGSTGAKTLTAPVVGIAAGPGGTGYWEGASNGGIFAFGVPFCGSTGQLKPTKPPGGTNSITLTQPIVGIAATSDGTGYWLVSSDGSIYSFGDAQFYGSLPSIPVTPSAPIVGIAATPDGAGYWLVGSNGSIYSFGDAHYYGSTGQLNPDKPPGGTNSITLTKPIVGIAATPDGHGYWLVASDGGIFSFGDAVFHGSMGGKHLNAPIVGMASTPDGNGYWEVASDGGIFSFGDAKFYGSTGQLNPDKPPGGTNSITLTKPAVGMAFANGAPW